MHNKQDLIEKAHKLSRGQGHCLLSGSLIMKGETKIFASGDRTLQDDDPTAHAPVFTIRRARVKEKSFLLQDYEIYTSEYPCNMCLLAMFQAGIKKTYYTDKKEIKCIELTHDVLMQSYKTRIF